MSEEKKLMMINVTHAEESRVAIVTDGVLEAFEIETFDHKALKGNIYKGRVESIQPGLQAAFVDVGGARGGFLPLDEVNFKLHAPRKEGGRGRLENHLHKGQELLVQVVRDAYGTKPPTLSTYFSLPGRFLVLTPFAESTGISRKLDEKQRERLRKALDSLAVPANHGVIVRTAGAAATKIELARDLKYLLRLWETIEDAAKAVRAPKLIYQERSLVIRTIRDLYTPDIDEILVDDVGAAEEIVEFFDIVLPQKKNSVKLYQGDRPLFNKFNLEEQIENIFRRRVALPSGGAVIFDQTEALTAVDVNSGKMTHEGNVEETALKANVEAAEEIARQMRLRDLGGLVVIDFIDMRAPKNNRQVEKVMKEALKRDKARYDVTRISSLGLMEISRERITAGKSSLRYTDCPTCDGTGSIKTIEAAALQALRRLQTAVVRGDLDIVEMVLPAEVAEYLLNQKRDELVGWEERYRTQIIVRSDSGFIRDRCEVRTVQRERQAAASPIVVAPSHQEIIAAVEAEEAAEAARAAAPAGVVAGAVTGEGELRKRRRRRRGGRKHRRDREAAPAEGTEGQPAAGSEGPFGGTDADEDDYEDAGAEMMEDTEAMGTVAGAEATAPGEQEPGGEGERRKRRRRRRRRKNGGPAPQAAEAAAAGAGTGPAARQPASAPARGDLEGAPPAGDSPAAAPSVVALPPMATPAAPVSVAVPPAPAATAAAGAPLAAIVARIDEPRPDAPRPLWWQTLLRSAAGATTIDRTGDGAPARPRGSRPTRGAAAIDRTDDGAGTGDSPGTHDSPGTGDTAGTGEPDGAAVAAEVAAHHQAPD